MLNIDGRFVRISVDKHKITLDHTYCIDGALDTVLYFLAYKDSYYTPEATDDLVTILQHLSARNDWLSSAGDTENHEGRTRYQLLRDHIMYSLRKKEVL
jgi:hypothetical protein